VTANFKVTGKTLTVSDLQYWDYGELTVKMAAWANFAKSTTGVTPIIRPYTEIGFPVTDADDKKISLTYNELNEITKATPTDKKWWYNRVDGFFYYIAPLPAGAVTSPLLESLTLDASAGQVYAQMDFDLIVNMEAIQNTSAALLGADGWNLGNQTNTVFNALKGYCDPPVS
jgi:hypothetical protein